MIILEKQTVTLKTGVGWHALIPFEQEGYEKVGKMRDGQRVAVTARRARNPAHHAKFFAVLNVVFQNQDQFKSSEDLREATLIEAGYSELRELLDGTRYRVARSIAFHNLGQDEFEPVYNACVDLWCQHFGWERDVLETVGKETALGQEEDDEC